MAQTFMINTMGGGPSNAPADPASLMNPEEDDLLDANGQGTKSEYKELKEKLEEQVTALDKIDRFIYK